MGKLLFLFILLLPFSSQGCDTLLGRLVYVGPYSSGQDLAQVGFEAGYAQTAVTDPKPPHPYAYAYRPEHFQEVIPFEEDVEGLAAKLLQNPIPIRAVYAASQWRPSVADKLRDTLRRMGIPLLGNTLDLADAREDKAAFYETLVGKKIPTVPYVYTDSVDSALEFSRHQASFPIVIKPSNEAGSRGVHFCHTEKEIADTFAKLLLGRPKGTKLLVQRRMTEQEYAINGIRAGNEIWFTGIWKYTREDRGGASTIYKTDHLLPFQGKVQDRLVLRTAEVLAAVDHEGPFHLETFDDLPNDFGPRPPGGRLNNMEFAATGRNPFRMAHDSHLHPEKLQVLSHGYSLKKHAIGVHISTEGGVRASYRLEPVLEQMKKDGLIVSYKFNHPENALLERTVDSWTTVASVQVAHEDSLMAETLAAGILDWKDRGYFEKP